MRRKQPVLGRWFWNLALAGALGLAPAAVAQESGSGYAENVPEALRDLVSPEDFDAVAGTLAEARQGAVRDPLDLELLARIAASPCGDSLADLLLDFYLEKEVPPALDLVASGMRELPPGYHAVNPWKAAEDGSELLRLMLEDFLEWCVFLPQINGSDDNGLEHIQRFAWFYYKNAAAKDFVQGRNPLDPSETLATGLEFTNAFSNQRGDFMSSAASRRCVPQWVADPRIEISDYKKQQASDYDSWNDFFAREITQPVKNGPIPSRPVTMPDRDYVVSAPTDCIMNPLVQVLMEDGAVRRRMIENPLQDDTVLDVKGIPIGLDRLLGRAPQDLKDKFVGGTGLSCVLMPNTYHHFHTPVSGTVRHAEVISKRVEDGETLPEGTFGYIDWPNWVPLDGNVGRPGTDFSQFEAFERGVVIIEVRYEDLDGTELVGWVASIPVGLDTIGSVVLDPDVEKGFEVTRGETRLGNFYYGGSLNIMLFSEGLASGVVQTRLGNQITLLNVGEPPQAPVCPLP